jgi:hypothetical protein
MTAAGRLVELKEAQRMFRSLSLAGALVALSVAGSGCVVSGSVRSSAYVESEPPDMVLVEPGVYVLADYDRPVFYTNGYYWLYSDGYWLRSYSYGGGFVRVRAVPYGVRRIHRPYAYVRYRPTARARYYRAPGRDRVIRASSRSDRRYHRATPVRRDNRYHRATPVRRDNRYRSAPRREPPRSDHRTRTRSRDRDRDDDRDHRDDRRDDRRERRERR